MGGYEVRKFPAERIPSVLTMEIAKRRHTVALFLEVDITNARRRIREIREESGRPVSMTAWVATRVARCAARHKEVHALKSGLRKIYVFDDVNISVMVEREYEGKKLPLLCVVRAVNEKDVFQVSEEIRAAQTKELRRGEMVIGGEAGPSAPTLLRIFNALPIFLRRGIFRLSRFFPRLTQRTAGTVIITAVGMYGLKRAWGWPLTIHPLTITLGGIDQMPAFVDGEVVPRDFLHMTIQVDHDVIDGAPATRFAAELVQDLESGEGLLTAMV